ncbi:molecular chaperone Tir [Mesorhizobium sp. LSJC255A00]|nr:molecular chaperone Tir [Mesorhizobium sp. LSJC255A00]
MEALRELSGGGNINVRNLALWEKLGWGEDRYNITKERLKGKGQIKGGPGGTICLPQSATAVKPKPLKAFLSYSHRDAAIKTDLISHLAPLSRLGLVEAWHDGEIETGDKWADAIKNNLESADIIILLVSVDFINSRYCNQIELTRAMEREANKAVVIVPVIARNCLWQEEPFGSIQAALKGAAIASFRDRDEALTLVAGAIKEKALAMFAERNAAKTR